MVANCSVSSVEKSSVNDLTPFVVGGGGKEGADGAGGGRVAGVDDGVGGEMKVEGGDSKSESGDSVCTSDKLGINIGSDFIAGESNESLTLLLSNDSSD